MQQYFFKIFFKICDMFKSKGYKSKNKEIFNKTKRHPTEWEKIFANDMTNKRLIFNIYKQLIQLNNQKTEQSDLNSAEDPNRPCSKENM